MRIAPLFFITFCTILCGIFFAALQYQIILFNPRVPAPVDVQQTTRNKKKCTLFFPHQNTLKSEEVDLLWGTQVVENSMSLINRWCTLLEEEGYINKKIVAETIAVTHTGEAFISFNQNWLPKQASLHQKSMFIEALFASLRHAQLPITTVRLLVRQQPMHDGHLDFTHSWPLRGFLSIQQVPQAIISSQKPLILIDYLNSRRGRTVHQQYEQSIIIPWAEMLQSALYEHLPDATIHIMSQTSQLTPHEKATYINQQQPYLVIQLGCYAEQDELPHIDMHYRLLHPETDFWPLKQASYKLISYDQAHRMSLQQTAWLAHVLVDKLATQYQQKAIIGKPHGLPLHTAAGFTSPTLFIELGLPSTKQWQSLLQTVANTIANCLGSSL